MGQSWYIVNLDKHIKLHIWKLGETFYSGPLSHRILGRLPPIQLLPYLRPPPSHSYPSPIKPKGIASLPNELMDEVFSYLDGHADCIRLALTSRRHWNLARRHIQRAITSYLEDFSWAGDRLICIGDYAKLHDPPPSLQPEEYIGLVGSGIDYFFADAASCSAGWGTPGGEAFRYQLYKSLQRIDMGRQFRRCNGLKAIWLDCVPVTKVDLDSDELVLRNLSKHEYVRWDTLPIEMAPSQIYVDLTWAVHARICWSPDPSTAMPYEGDIHRGVWAGDRFDIMRLEDFEDLKKMEGEKVVWKDVSDSVAKELGDIITAQWPPEE